MSPNAPMHQFCSMRQVHLCIYPLVRDIVPPCTYLMIEKIILLGWVISFLATIFNDECIVLYNFEYVTGDEKNG